MKKIVLFLALLSGSVLYAQDEEEDYFCRNHIALGSMYMKVLAEEGEDLAKTNHAVEDMKMIHVHYMRLLKENIGVGLQLGTSPSHWKEPMIGAIAEYRPLYNVAVDVIPGVNKYHSRWRFNAATHLRYDYHIGQFMVAPSVGWMYMNKNHHIGGGVHVGVHF